MKILCVIDNLGSGGAQRQLTAIAVGLKARGHTVEFFTYYPEDHFKPELDRAGIPVHLSLKRSRFSFKPLFALRRLIRKSGFDAVLAFLETPALYAELASWPTREWGLVVGERSANPGMARGTKRLMRHFHRLADAVITNSRANKKMLYQHFPALKRKLGTIYNVVDLDRFKPLSTETSSLPDGTVRVVVSASYQANKNMEGIAKALLLFEQDSHSQGLVVDWYGGMPADKSAHARVTNFISENGLTDRLRLHSQIRNIEREFQHATAIGLFSFYEGLPNTICEGMACAKPILMSDVCDARILVRDGTNGFLCNPHSPESIASAFKRLLSLSRDERTAFGQESRRRAELLFSPAAVVDNYEKVLTSVVAREPLPRSVLAGPGAPTGWDVRNESKLA